METQALYKPVGYPHLTHALQDVKQLQDDFPCAHQGTTGLLLSWKFCIRAVAHLFNSCGKYQDFSNRKKTLCSSCLYVSSTKLLSCSIPFFTLNNSGMRMLCKNTCIFHLSYENLGFSRLH